MATSTKAIKKTQTLTFPIMLKTSMIYPWVRNLTNIYRQQTGPIPPGDSCG